MANVTDEDLGKIAFQYHKLLGRVLDGSLDAYIACVGLEGVAEGKRPRGILIAESHQEYESTCQPPAWWRTPEQ